MKHKASPRTILWESVFSVTNLAILLYVISEWIFFVSKTSFMDILSFYEKAWILFQTICLLFTAINILLIMFVFLSKLPFLKYLKFKIVKGSLIIPALIFSFIYLLVFDNLTYSLFKFGIVSTHGLNRKLYLLLFILFFVYVFKKLYLILRDESLLHKNKITSKLTFIWYLTFAISSFITLFGIKNNPYIHRVFKNNNEQKLYPNIIIITADGVNASHMSAYGYNRNTTPHIDSIIQDSLVAENAFSVAGNTTGSIVSLYTGKYPTTVRVIYPPDILRGQNSYQHLPSILNLLGYHTIQVGVDYYADAQSLNLLNGFNFINGESVQNNKFLTTIRQLLPENVGFFIYEISSRLTDRLAHLFHIKEMNDPYEEVTKPNTRINENKRLTEVLNSIEQLNNINKPLFLHVHFMVTHGELFNPKERLFSINQIQNPNGWDTDFYDDAILEFDSNIKLIMDALIKQGVIENTVLVISSDHGQKYSTTERIPLIIRFPNKEHTGIFKSNTQSIDIAPTILDYIKFPVPSWMSGLSLLNDFEPNRLIIGSGVYGTEKNQDNLWQIKPSVLVPPFYQFGYLTIISCQNWYKYDLKEYKLRYGQIDGHTYPCNESPHNENKILEIIIARLQEDGFDVNSLIERINNQ